MRTWIEINQGALRANYRAFCGLVGVEKVMPVVKSNGYGHGLELVASILMEEGVKQLGVNYAAEGQILRAVGFTGTVLVVGPVFPEDLEIAVRHNLEVMLAGKEILHSWRQRSIRPKAHLKFDTGCIVSIDAFAATESLRFMSDRDFPLWTLAFKVIALVFHAKSSDFIAAAACA